MDIGEHSRDSCETCRAIVARPNTHLEPCPGSRGSDEVLTATRYLSIANAQLHESIQGSVDRAYGVNVYAR